MKSIILELQQAAMEKSSAIDDLLRKCVVIATKLKLENLASWAKRELNGYAPSDEVPDYRELSGELRSFNPYNGVWMPIIWQDETPDDLLKRKISQSVGQLQDLLQASENGKVTMKLPEQLGYHMMQDADLPTPPVLVFGTSSLVGILDTVRNLILEWSLKLEADGILGEGMTFSKEEKKMATGNTYNINNFTGVLGDVTSESTQIGDYNSLHADLKALGISQEDRNELEGIMDRVPKAKRTEKKRLVAQGIEWVTRNGDKLGKLSDSIRGWLEAS